MILLAMACAVACSGRPRAHHRLRSIAGVGDGPTGLGVPRWLAAPAIVGVALVAGGVSAVVATGILLALIGWRGRRRRRAEQADRHRDELLTALALMIAELSVGAPPARACAAAAAEMVGPYGYAAQPNSREDSESVASALATLAGRAELGGGVIGGEVHSGASDHSWHRIAVAWQTSDRYGLPLAELLGSVRADLLARKAFVERTQAGMAGPRATASVLAGLPLLGIALGQATGARPLSTLLGGGIGGILLVIGTGLIAAGMVWSERIAQKVLAP